MRREGERTSRKVAIAMTTIETIQGTTANFGRAPAIASPHDLPTAQNHKKEEREGRGDEEGISTRGGEREKKMMWWRIIEMRGSTKEEEGKSERVKEGIVGKKRRG